MGGIVRPYITALTWGSVSLRFVPASGPLGVRPDTPEGVTHRWRPVRTPPHGSQRSSSSRWDGSSSHRPSRKRWRQTSQIWSWCLRIQQLEQRHLVILKRRGHLFRLRPIFVLLQCKVIYSLNRARETFCTDLFLYAFVGIHQVRILVFNIYQRCPMPLNTLINTYLLECLGWLLSSLHCQDQSGLGLLVCKWRK